MTVSQLNHLIKKGELLVVLDDLVLSLGTYISSHPGGTEVLKRCNGRDISKYFYGGYRMLGMEPQVHSQLAM